MPERKFLASLMKSKIIPIATHRFNGTEAFFIDTNIWIFLYGRQDPTDPRIRIYSSALDQILEKGCRVYVDVLVFSEFINRYARIEHKFAMSKGGPTDYKAFRNSAAFQSAAQGIVAACRSILKTTARTESFFEQLNINSILNDYEAQHRDFNDQMLREICLKKKLHMISHDADFRDLGVTVLTANKKLLSLP